MRIAEIISSFKSRGGAEVFLSSLCCCFKKNSNVELLVISLYDSIDQSIKDKFASNNILVVTCKKKNGLDLKSSKLLKKYLTSFNPDIVNFHLTCLLSYFFAFRFKKKKWKLVETFHSIPGKDADFVTSFLRKKYIKKKMLFFIGISDEITCIAKTRYASICCDTIYNGIELPEKNYSLEKKYDFIIVASLTPVKNHPFLFDTFIDVISIHKEAKLICVGGGPEFDNYKDFIEERHLSNNIILIGPRDDVSPFLEQSSCFVLASIREGNPISILEAMSKGLPIIAPRIGGIPDVVTENENGFLYEVNNKNQLFKLLLLGLEDKKTMSYISTNNFQKSRNYSIEYCADRYYHFFKSLLS